MHRILKLYKNLSIQPYLRFYEIMNYPVPKNTELFFQYSDTEHTNANKLLKDTPEEGQDNSFSRDQKCEYMDEYLREIKKLKSTFQSIPFVEQIGWISQRNQKTQIYFSIHSIRRANFSMQFNQF